MFKNEIELEGVRGDVIGINNIISVIFVFVKVEDDVFIVKFFFCVFKKSD